MDWSNPSAGGVTQYCLLLAVWEDRKERPRGEGGTQSGSMWEMEVKSGKDKDWHPWHPSIPLQPPPCRPTQTALSIFVFQRGSNVRLCCFVETGVMSVQRNHFWLNLNIIGSSFGPTHISTIMALVCSQFCLRAFSEPGYFEGFENQLLSSIASRKLQ